MDLSQFVPYVEAHALWIGSALVAAGVAVRLVGHAIGRALLVTGLLGTAVFAYQEYLAAHNLLLSSAIALGGLLLFGLLAWTVRGLSFLFAFVLLAAGFYLAVYGWAGAAFVSSTVGSFIWATATIVTMVLSGVRLGTHRVPTAVVTSVLH